MVLVRRVQVLRPPRMDRIGSISCAPLFFTCVQCCLCWCCAPFPLGGVGCVLFIYFILFVVPVWRQIRALGYSLVFRDRQVR